METEKEAPKTPEPPPASLSGGRTTPTQSSRGKIRSRLAGMGYQEGADALSLRGAGGPGADNGAGHFPFAKQIQRSFGSHDVFRIESRIGGAAASEADRRGAEAYTVDGKVHFRSHPDVRTAAHEATHALQQAVAATEGGKVSKSSDRSEQDAEEVADLVGRGESAEEKLDSVLSTTSSVPGVQRKEKKTVSSKAGKRLTLAQDAIEHTKNVIALGAGNQYNALKKTNFNSYFRMLVMRGDEYWEIDDSVKKLAAAHPEALVAAKADLAKGGNCGEHAAVAFDYLRVHAIGETLNRADVNGLNHAFILLGNVSSDSDKDLVVSDPWPTAATACLWEDHFAYTPDRGQINVRHRVVGDGSNVKAVIARGLRLKPEGQKLIETSLSSERTDEELKKGADPSTGHPWIWRHPGTTAEGHDYEYQRGG